MDAFSPSSDIVSHSAPSSGVIGSTSARAGKAKKVTRGSKFDEDEVEQLCKSWLHVS